MGSGSRPPAHASSRFVNTTVLDRQPPPPQPCLTGTSSFRRARLLKRRMLQCAVHFMWHFYIVCIYILYVYVYVYV
jgi:hypothetical protein